MAKSQPTILLALEAFVCEVDGERLAFSAGDPIEADHPAVKANPHLFGPLVFRHPTRERIEQATAAPGEQRNVGPRPATATEEKGIAATVKAESAGHPMRVSDLHGKRGA